MGSEMCIRDRVNVHLLDHFIQTDTEYFSMRDANRLPIYDFKTGTLFWP